MEFWLLMDAQEPVVKEIVFLHVQVKASSMESQEQQNLMNQNIGTVIRYSVEQDQH